MVENEKCNGDIIKFVISTALFDVLLTLADMVTDMKLMITWYLLGHWKFSTAMLIPVMTNYMFSFYTWFRIEGIEYSKEKERSCIFVLLGIWKEYKAIMIMREAFKDLENAQKNKLKLIRETGGIEPFLESLPTIIVLNYCRDWQYEVYGSFNEDIFGSYTLFYTTFIVSIMSASFGVTSFLKNGPYAMLPNDGLFGGILTWRFIVALLACCFTIFGKIYMIHHIMLRTFYKSIINLDPNNTEILPLEPVMPDIHIEPDIYIDISAMNGSPFEIVQQVFLLIGFNVLISGILTVIGLAMCIDGRGKVCCKLITRYPMLVLLSTFTFFTIGPRKWRCCKPNNQCRHESTISVSRLLSVVNILVTISSSIFLLVFIIVDLKQGNIAQKSIIILTTILPLLLGAFFTILLFYLKPFTSGSCCGPNCCDLRKSHQFHVHISEKEADTGIRQQRIKCICIDLNPNTLLDI